MTEVRFAGVYSLSGYRENVDKAVARVRREALSQTKPLEVTASDFVGHGPEGWPGTRYVFTGNDARKYQDFKPLLRILKQAQRLVRENILRGDFFTQSKPLLENYADAEDFARRLSPKPPKGWAQFQSTSLRKMRFIDVESVDLGAEIDKGNFSLRSGAFRHKPEKHVEYRYQTLDPIGRSELVLSDGIPND